MVIRITADRVRNGTKQELSVAQFCQIIGQNTVTGMRKRPIPDGVKWIVEKGGASVYIIEIPPGLRNLLWRDGCDEWDDEDYEGPSSSEAYYTVATPYVVLKAWFIGNKLHMAEVYYRNRPLSSIDDQLYHTNLKNTMRIESAPGHICLGSLKLNHLQPEEAISELVNFLWAGQFNDELDETNFNDMAKRDSRLESISAWERASKQDPNFVLGVDWIPAKTTVRQIIQNSKMFYYQPLSRAKELGNLILKSR